MTNNSTIDSNIRRVAAFNPSHGRPIAELEIIRRFEIAGRCIGLEIKEFACVSEMRSFRPDFVLSMHHTAAKLCGIPTYGCMWNPPIFIAGNSQFIHNVMSLDGFLSAGPFIDRWIKDLLYTSQKQCFITHFYPSCYATTYRPLEFRDPKLFYCGTNWDGPRYSDIFGVLDNKAYMRIYGPQPSWNYIRNAYCGTVPFDGTSILARLQEAGVGLCLHTKTHIEAGIPSARIFEIVASSAVAICQDHPFIRETFGDSVLYIEIGDNPKMTEHQIDACLSWIKSNPDNARKMTARAHQIFSENFTLEKSLHNVLECHEKLMVEKFRPIPANLNRLGLVQVIMRVGNRPPMIIRRALESVMKQTYPNVEILMICFREIPGLDVMISEFRGKVKIRIFESEDIGSLSFTLWDGLKKLTGEYFAILDDDDEYFPNHLATLVKILDQHCGVNLAYSGSVRYLESGLSSTQTLENGPEETSDLSYFEPFDACRLLRNENFITSNAWVARTSALKPWMLVDPEIVVFEDYFLLMCLMTTSKFVFSYEATCCFYHRKAMNDNVSITHKNEWEKAIKRVNSIFKECDFMNIAMIKSFILELDSIKREMKTRFEETRMLRVGNSARSIEASRMDDNGKLIRNGRKIKKLIKYILPYGFVRFYQIYIHRQSGKEKL